MSKDFPDRTDWLKRCQLKPKPPRVLHTSARLLTIKNKDLPGYYYVVERPGKTYRKPVEKAHR